MLDYEVQYLVNVQIDNVSYLVGPLATPDDAVNWIYNQIGSLKVAFPETELEKIKWDYAIDTSSFMEEDLLDIVVKFGEYHLTVLEMKNPKTVRIHPECKEFRDRHKSGELSDEILF